MSQSPGGMDGGGKSAFGDRLPWQPAEAGQVEERVPIGRRFVTVGIYPRCFSLRHGI
jgi:hypothetical protein